MSLSFISSLDCELDLNVMGVVDTEITHWVFLEDKVKTYNETSEDNNLADVKNFALTLNNAEASFSTEILDCGDESHVGVTAVVVDDPKSIPQSKDTHTSFWFQYLVHADNLKKLFDVRKKIILFYFLFTFATYFKISRRYFWDPGKGMPNPLYLVVVAVAEDSCRPVPTLCLPPMISLCP